MVGPSIYFINFFSSPINYHTYLPTQSRGR
jgi:hypothetical protein